MNGTDLMELMLAGLGAVTAVNLVIQFFQIVWEEFRRCSIIRAEQKKSEAYGDDAQLWKFRQEQAQELF